MNCPHCESHRTRHLNQTTRLGYKKYACQDCGKQYNERTGTKFNFITYPTTVIILVVQYYYLFKVSLEDVVKLMLMRGFHLSHQTVHNWAQAFGPELALTLRKRRKGKCGYKWHIDATYLWVEGRWRYLYRAIDKEGNLVDVYLSDVRDQAAAKQFFLQAENTTGMTPDQITTNKEPALAAAHEEVFGNGAKHRDCKYKNNLIEQDHRGIKSRSCVMKGFKDIFCALRFCTTFEEIRNYYRVRNKTGTEKRNQFASKLRKMQHLAFQAC